VREAEYIVGLMGWVVWVQLTILALHVVNFGVAVTILTNHRPQMEAVGSLVASVALVTTSYLAHRYQRRLGRELDHVLRSIGYPGEFR